MTQVTTKSSQPLISSTVMGASTLGHVSAFTSLHTNVKMSYPSQSQLITTLGSQPQRSFLAIRPDWQDCDVRQTHMETAIEHGIAWQIRTNRRLREMSQVDLANAIGTTQPGIARVEDPEYGKQSLETLTKIANAFDCALSVRFISYSALARELEDLSPEKMFAQPFSAENTIELGSTNNDRIK